MRIHLAKISETLISIAIEVYSETESTVFMLTTKQAHVKRNHDANLANVNQKALYVDTHIKWQTMEKV